MDSKPDLDQIKAALVQHLTEETIAGSTLEILDMCMDGKFNLDEMMLPGLTARELLAVDGFYASKNMTLALCTMVSVRIQQLIITKQLGLPGTGENLQVLMSPDLVAYTVPQELEAAKITMARCIIKYGIPERIDEAGAVALIKKVQASWGVQK